MLIRHLVAQVRLLKELSNSKLMQPIPSYGGNSSHAPAIVRISRLCDRNVNDIWTKYCHTALQKVGVVGDVMFDSKTKYQYIRNLGIAGDMSCWVPI